MIGKGRTDMYRTYENPWVLEDALEEAKVRLAEAKQSDDDDAIMWAEIEVHELEERVNYAWQDDEYDALYEREYCGEEAW